MSKETKISKIELTIGGKAIVLTIEQAKELKDILLEIWPQPVKVRVEKEYIPAEPIIINRPYPIPHVPRPRPYWPEIWCRSGTLSMTARA